MSQYVWKISSTGIITLAERLFAETSVIAPVRTQFGDVDYDEITHPSRICWNYDASLMSLKRFFLPQVETLFEFTCNNGASAIKPVQDEKHRVFLAVRSCDVAAIHYLDQAYQRDYMDPNYALRRKNSLLISLACNKAATPTCHCVCGDGGPFLNEGYDIQLTWLSPDYLVEVGSQKGSELIAKYNRLFESAHDSDKKLKQSLMKKAEASFGEHTAYTAAALRRMTKGDTTDEEWQRLSEFCLGCSGCSFVCPTCTCFTTCDQMQDDTGGVRERHWDACSLQCYSREASGHNPRKEQWQRMKARFFHKLSYQFVLRNGRHACVGCGRCINACYGESSMTQVTRALRREA